MNAWDPFHRITYFLHTLLGATGVLAAITALIAVKGTATHIVAGRVFAGAATIAALTALLFGDDAPSSRRHQRRS